MEYLVESLLLPAFALVATLTPARVCRLHPNRFPLTTVKKSPTTVIRIKLAILAVKVDSRR